MKKEKTKSKEKTSKGGMRIALVALACIMLIGVIMSGLAYCSKNLTGGKFGIFGKDVNQDNLIKREAYFDNLLGEADCGIKFNWKDDGSVVISGKYKTEDEAPLSEYFKYRFITVDLAPGVYTLSTGNDKIKDDNYGIYYEYLDHEARKCTGYVSSDAAVIDLSSAGPSTILSLSIFVRRDVKLWGMQSKLYPTLVTGSEAGAFYN